MFDELFHGGGRIGGMVMVRLTESGGDGFAVWMDVFEGEDGEH